MLPGCIREQKPFLRALPGKDQELMSFRSLTSVFLKQQHGHRMEGKIFKLLNEELTLIYLHSEGDVILFFLRIESD